MLFLTTIIKMPVYHIVLFKLKPNVLPDQIAEWSKLATQMVGKIPGLLEFYANHPLTQTAKRAKGYDMGVVAILETPADILPYGEHPAHQEVHKLREQLCSETLVYDLEFEPSA
ncbi:hypothetical protein N431DRAFT_180994 [Stipitochalara longipes BDJ]|nr:hypothetical protein N431DRAFT_180994 [Stipitochalara longipes BDJ]